MRKLVRSLMLGAALVALGTGLPSVAAPITMGFTPISFPAEVSVPDQADLTAVAGQFSVTIDYIDVPQFILDMNLTPQYTKMISFAFSNVGPVGSNITEIYWDWTTDPALLDATTPPPGGFYDDPSGETWLLAAPTAPSGVVNPWQFPAFVAEAGGDGAGTGQVAGLRNTDPTTTFYMGIGTDPNNPNVLADWDMIVSSLTAGDIQFGLHVRSIETYAGSSYHFISVPYVDDNTPVVPVPAAAGLGFLGMALIGVIRRKKA